MYQEYHAKYYIPQKILHLKMALIFVLYKCSMGNWNRSRSRQRDGVSHFFTQYVDVSISVLEDKDSGLDRYVFFAKIEGF